MSHGGIRKKWERYIYVRVRTAQRADSIHQLRELQIRASSSIIIIIHAPPPPLNFSFSSSGKSPQMSNFFLFHFQFQFYFAYFPIFIMYNLTCSSILIYDHTFEGRDLQFTIRCRYC